MDKNIFEFNEYKSYLRQRLEGNRNRGSKGRFAKAIGVQAAFVSQVVTDRAHLSLEQADLSNKFFNHSLEEAEYFLLLVQKDRSGTRSLRSHFQTQIEKIKKQRFDLVNRLGKVKTLNEEDRAWYYSSWLPIAFHIGCTIPGFQSVEALSKAFNLKGEKCLDILSQLEKMGLITREGLKYKPAINQIRIGRDSNHVVKHHTNLRVLAIDSLPREELADLHYSAVVSLSKKDVLKIKDILLENIKISQEIIKESLEEELYGFNIDLFNMIRE